MELKSKKVAILGMGIEGMALAEYLQGKVAGLFLLDQTPIEGLKNGPHASSLDRILSSADVWGRFGDNYLANIQDYDVIFRSPGISYYNEELIKARESGVEISSQIKLFFELCPSMIIGVTGTKGKGTTSSLIEKILKDSSKPVYIAGNIGYPALTLLSKLKSDDIVILELSSFQLMDLDVSPHIAVVTNLMVDHLDYHRDIDEYLDSKLNIVRFQKSGDFAVVKQDVLNRIDLLKKTAADVRTFSSNDSTMATAIIKEIDGDHALYLEKKLVCKLSELKLLGKHNLENIAAAVIVSSILDISLEQAKKSVAEFKGLPHRLEIVTKHKKILFINDSFATNPLPTIAAIEAISNNKILILGGSSKGADFSELAEKIVTSKVSGVVLIGVEGDKIKDALEKSGYNGEIRTGADNMDEIVGDAIEMAKTGDAILLSPACASFGLFKDYKDRGDKFKKSVLELTAGVR